VVLAEPAQAANLQRLELLPCSTTLPLRQQFNLKHKIRLWASILCQLCSSTTADVVTSLTRAVKP
jgi:hypothetical protein